jgi:hypothetical protein
MKIIIEMERLPENLEPFGRILVSFLGDFKEKGQREERWIGDQCVTLMVMDH